MANRVENSVGQHHRLQSRDPTSRMTATSPAHPPSQARPEEPRNKEKLVQASGSLRPTPPRTAPIVQKSAPRRHEITDPRFQAKGRGARDARDRGCPTDCRTIS